jgi:hypothetical protein
MVSKGPRGWPEKDGKKRRMNPGKLASSFVTLYASCH